MPLDNHYVAGLIKNLKFGNGEWIWLKWSTWHPRIEMYGLTSQIRRSAVSVVSNIAEGAARRSDREFLQFLYIALGSLAEMETQLILAHRLKYLHATQKVTESLVSVRRMLTGLITHLKQKEHHHA